MAGYHRQGDHLSRFLEGSIETAVEAACSLRSRGGGAGGGGGDEDDEDDDEIPVQVLSKKFQHLSEEQVAILSNLSQHQLLKGKKKRSTTLSYTAPSLPDSFSRRDSLVLLLFFLSRFRPVPFSL